MARLGRLSVVLALILAACGQVEPVLLAVGMPGCAYQGPASMREGEVSLSLTLNGLGDVGAAVVALGDDNTYEELQTFLATDTPWEARPGWVAPVIELRLDDTEGLDGVEGTAQLDEGSYAVVCIDHPYDQEDSRATAASPLSVKPG